MLINEAAKACGITKKAIQYYVEQGLITPVLLENGYRDFSKYDIDQLKKIVLYRRLGLSIFEIKNVLKNPDEVKQILARRILEAEKEKARQEILKKVESGVAIECLEQEINTISSNTIIMKKLEELFPGYYGTFISLNFSRYLTGELESEEQMEAFGQIIGFFDHVPDLQLPPDLKEYLEHYSEEFSGVEVSDMISHIVEEKELAFQNIEAFIENNKALLEEYSQFRKTKEYIESPAGRLVEYMKQFCQTSGYYDIFIPAMRKLSPLYEKYYEQMIKANEIFIRKYPEYSI